MCIRDRAITLFDLADYLPEMDLDCPGVTTRGGYVISRMGYIPEEGEEVRIGRYRAVVTGSDGRRITQKMCIRDRVNSGKRWRAGLPASPVWPE